MRVDLQCHSTASDGSLRPSDVVALAKTNKVDVLALTDHDTVDGVPEAVAAGSDIGVQVVAGIELSCRDDAGSVHMLGLFVDIENPELAGLAQKMRAERLDRARAMVERLNELGYAITFEQVAAKAGDGVIGRPHVARALVDAGYIPAVGFAFTPDLLEDGGRADVQRPRLDPETAIQWIHSWGGVAVIAHPFATRRSNEPAEMTAPTMRIRRLAHAGLDGIEAEHPDHEKMHRRTLRKLASELGLRTTGGSDFHGSHGSPPGTFLTPESDYFALAAISRRRKEGS